MESGAEVVILEGTAQPLANAMRGRELSAAYNVKYCWDLDPAEDAGWYEFRRRKAFGWLVDDTGEDRGAVFHGTVTRWRWP